MPVPCFLTLICFFDVEDLQGKGNDMQSGTFKAAIIIFPSKQS